MWHELEHVIDNLSVDLVHLVDKLDEVIYLSAHQESLPLGRCHILPVFDGETLKEVVHVSELRCNKVDALNIHSVKECSLEVGGGHADEGCLPLGLREGVDVAHSEAADELLRHALVEKLPDV